MSLDVAVHSNNSLSSVKSLHSLSTSLDRFHQHLQPVKDMILKLRNGDATQQYRSASSGTEAFRLSGITRVSEILLSDPGA